MENKITIKKPDVREKALEHGVPFLYDEELVMLILGTGTKKTPIQSLALKIKKAMDDCDSDDIVENLKKIKGIGIVKALTIAASIELGKRKCGCIRAPIRYPKDVTPFLKSYAVNTKEHFLVVTLNGAHEIIQIHVVSVGTLNRSIVHPREIFQVAIKENASAIILCHNHPSGNCEPSEEDIETTKVLIEASEIIGIEILDHIIIDRENYFSFVENNILFEIDS